MTDNAISPDGFEKQYANQIDGFYDCVDRVVLNGHCRHASSPGGFRCFWRKLFGNDDNLDDTHVMRLAGRFSRRLRAWAQKQEIPVLNAWDFSDDDKRMHAVASEHLPTDADFKGVFCITVHRAPGPLRKIKRYGNGGIDIKTKLVYVNHYAFHIWDPQWGHLTIKLCGHPPFPAQIALNGHHYVASQMRRNGVGLTQEGNCFTDTSDAAALSQCAETLRDDRAIGRLREACERWITTCCLCFALSHAEQKQTDFRYEYSVYQMELSRNFWFRQGRAMEDFFQTLIDRCRRRLDVRRLKTIFGRKQRPHKKKARGKSPRLEVVVETPAYDLTVFKVHFGRLTLKVYTKGACVLRFEVIAHNTVDLGCGKELSRWPRLLDRLTEMLDRFLSTLSALDVCWMDDDTWDRLPEASLLGEVRVPGIDVNQPRMRAVLAAVLSVSLNPRGFRATELAEKVRELTGDDYTSSQAAYDLRKLRGKGLMKRVPRSHRYRAPWTALRTIAALTVLREHVLKPLLANECKLPTSPINGCKIRRHHQNLRREIRSLLGTLGLAP